MKFADVTDETFQAWLGGMLAAYSVCSPGVYPAAFNGKERTVRQDGWNDACTAFLENVCAFRAECDRNDSFWKMGFYLINEDIASIHMDKDEPITLHINCGDTFYYACSDSEDVPESECEKVVNIYDEFDYDGLVAWIAIRRDADPIKVYQTDNFFKAKKFLLTTSQKDV